MSATSYYLAGDTGGTNTRLLLARQAGTGAPETMHREIYASAEYDSLDAILMEFLLDAPDLDGVCFAVAGPVHTEVDGRQHVRLTNLPWRIDSQTLAERFGFTHVRLLNDFEAIAHGLVVLDDDDFVTLQDGVPIEDGVRAVMGAGTGLGQAIAIPRTVHGHQRMQVIPSEAGHRDMAPATLHEAQLWHWLQGQFGRATWEHCLSGSGLLEIYRFSANEHCMSATALHEPAAISAAALKGDDPQAVAALDMFVGLYASCAANLALSCLPRGGLYLAGGIAPQILPRLQQADVVERFTHKAPMGALLKTIPLYVITHDSPGLLGALHVAMS